MAETLAGPGLFISQQDWSLHRQGRKDEERHDEKIKEAIRDNLPNIISDGEIITADPNSKKTIRIPLKSLELPDFRYGDNESGEGVGSGKGKEGDVFGYKPAPGEKGDGKEAGSGKGEEYYDTEFTLEEIRDMVFEQLGLPNLKPKATDLIPSEDIIFDDRIKKRTPTNLDKKKTLLANMKRNAREEGKAVVRDIQSEDYRVRTYKERMKEQNSAVVILMMDRSGSMGEDETYIARAMCWWTVEFLRSKYPKVDIVFIVHELDAKEVDNEQDFFKTGSSGGTQCSSANRLAIDVIKNRYPPDQYNIYPLHLSDGDNYSSDNEECIRLVQELLNMGINQYGYVQIGRQSDSALLSLYRGAIDDPRFNGVNIHEKEHVWYALQEIFKPDKQ